MIRVFFIDDHPLVLDGMTNRFASMPEIDVVGTAADVESGVVTLELASPRVDVVVLDLRVEGMEGVQTIETLRRVSGGLVLFSSRPKDALVNRLIDAGASAHVCKTAELAELDEAIRDCHAASGRAISPVGDASVTRLPHETLSSREREVYRLLADCQTPKQIAFELGVAPSTAYTHVERVVAKLGLDSPAEVVRYAIEFDVASP